MRMSPVLSESRPRAKHDGATLAHIRHGRDPSGGAARASLRHDSLEFTPFLRAAEARPSVGAKDGLLVAGEDGGATDVETSVGDPLPGARVGGTVRLPNVGDERSLEGRAFER
jgi:hypothetical protein